MKHSNKLVNATDGMLPKKKFSQQALTSALQQIVHNTTEALFSRDALLRSRIDGPDRDLDEECGWIKGEPEFEDYYELYRREGIAQRVVNIYPDSTWEVYPQIKQNELSGKIGTPFEEWWEIFEYEQNPWAYMHRADQMSGIGAYGGLLIGIDDGKKLHEPVSTINLKTEKRKGNGKDREVQHNVIYLRPFMQGSIRIKEWENDVNHPRYGKPNMYYIQMFNPRNIEGAGTPNTIPMMWKNVHWTRMLHLADNRTESEIFGTPRLTAVMNRMQDIRKVLGGSAEMFWKGAFPGYIFETLPELVNEADIDKTSLQKEVKAFTNGLQRYMQLTGMTGKSLAPQVADPSPHLNAQYHFLSATIGTPMKILFGSEMGLAAGDQDITNWNRKLNGRQTKYVNPYLISPFVQRLSAMAVCPWVEKTITKWADLNVISETDRADIALKKAQALLQYVQSGSEKVVPVKYFLTMFLDMSDAEAEAIIDTAMAGNSNGKLMTKELWTVTQAPKGAADPAKKTGAGGRKNSLGKAKSKPKGK